MADKEEILLEIVVSNDAATQAIFESQQSIEKLKKSQIDLTAEFKKGLLTSEEYSKKSTAVKVAISQQSEVIRLNEKELKNNIKSQKDSSDSLTSLRAQLSNNTKAYDNLSKAERDSAKGQELRDSILDITQNLSEAEQATERFRRQVGKYPDTMGGAGAGINQVTGFLGKMSSQVSAVSPQLGGIISQFGGFAAKSAAAASETNLMNESISQSGEALNAVEGFAGKATGSLNDLSSQSVVAGQATGGAFSAITKGAVTMGKAFLAPPIIIISAIILAIIGAVKLLSDGFAKNDEASTKLSEAFSIFTPILDGIGKIFTFVAGAVSDLILGMSEGIATIVDFTAGLFGIETGLSAAAEEARNLVKAQDALEEAERDFTVNSAKRNLERTKLMAEVTDKFKNDAKTRIALLADALELDKANLVDEKKIADEKLRIIELVAKNENDTSDDTAKKISDARAEAYNAQAKYFDGVKEINKKLSSAEEELANEQKAIFENWKKNKDEQISKQKVYLRQLEDLVTEEIKNDLARQIQAEKIKTQRANEDLKEKLKTEKNLTKEARAAINEIILLSNQNLKEKIDELNKKSTEEEIKKQIDTQQKIISAKIELATKGSDEELNLLYSKLELQKSIELSNLELTNVERLAIIDKYDEQETELRNKNLTDRQKLITDNLNKEFELKLLNASNNGAFDDEQARLELEKTQAQYDAIKNIDSETKSAMFQTQLDYELAIAQSQNNLIQAQNNVTESQLKNMSVYLDAFQTISSSLGSILSQMANDSIASAEFAKTLAVFNIGIALAEGIAGAIKASSAAAANPLTFVASILSGMASVGTAIATANKAFKPLPDKPKFAGGGLITGRGTGTSDSIDARVSNGESIINANSTSMFTPLLSSLNVAGGGVGFGSQQINNQIQGEEMLARAFAKGASMLPPPVLSLKEFHSADDRFTTIKELG